MKHLTMLSIAFLLPVLTDRAQKYDASIEKNRINKVLDENIQAIEDEDMDLLSKIVVHDNKIVVLETDVS